MRISTIAVLVQVPFSIATAFVLSPKTASKLTTDAPFNPSERPTFETFHQKQSYRTNLHAFFVSELADAYTQSLSDHYLTTQCLTSGLLSGIGDLIAQSKKSKELKKTFSVEEWDQSRSLTFLMKGLGGGLIWSRWYDLSDVLSSNILHGVSGCGAVEGIELFDECSHTTTAIARILTSISLEQFLACPIVFSLWDIPFPALMNSGVPVKEIPQRVKSKIGTLLMENAKVWTFVNVIIYAVPSQFRVLLSSVADLFWQSIVSEVASSPSSQPTSDKEESEVVLVPFPVVRSISNKKDFSRRRALEII